jgi:TRAP transporter TAXI family solute receptor
MKSRFLLVIVLVSVAVLVTTGIKVFLNHRRVNTLTLATAGEWGEYYKFGNELAKLLERHNPTIKVNVRPTHGSVQNMELLEDNSVQLAIVQNNVLTSQDVYAPSVRSVASLFPEVFHLIVGNNSDIQSVADLRGKQIACFPGGTGSLHLFLRIISHYGLTEDGFKYVELSPEEVKAAFERGVVDAAFHTMPLGNEKLRELLTMGDSRLVPLDQVPAMMLTRPYLHPINIPAGTYNASPPIPASDLPSAFVHAMLLTNEKLGNAVVKDITRIIYEYHGELMREYPLAANIRSAGIDEYVSLPLHPGAQAYLNHDKPSYFVKYADTLALSLSILVLLVSGCWHLRVGLKEKQKNRADAYNLRIMALIEQVHATSRYEDLSKVRRQLFAILQKVIEDLNKDKISPESFASFTFPWDVAIKAVRHREMILSGARPDDQLSGA